MTREEIGEVLAHLDLHLTYDGYLSAEDLDNIFQCLHSQGVVIRIKCPDCEWSQFKEECVGMTPCYSCNSTGYIIKPLIEVIDRGSFAKYVEE